MTDMTDEILARIGEGVALCREGKREQARASLAELWASIGRDALHRCALAHAMADAQDDPREELAWDLRALDEARQLTSERLAAAGVVSSVQGLYPSLHLNLADVYLRLGDHPRALEHVKRGKAAAQVLADDGYRAMIVSGLERVEASAV
jgi:hypothetical protein